ncbi:MAG: DNA-formamidopyrimidine glycosylase family protein [Pirellulaceae bacterium]
MPELPEVETMRRGILPIVGATIIHVERPACDCRPIAMHPRIDHFARRVKNLRISEVQRLGKRIVLMLSDRQAIVIEPRMTGLVLLAAPPTQTHLRLRITLTGGSHPELLFWDRRGLGTVRLLRPQELQSLQSDRLGPDALQISQVQLQERLGASRRAIKVALLDQRAVAGIGNLYAAEILHLAGVDPRCRCDAVSDHSGGKIMPRSASF